jgi:DNA (cytosine-5)-methyltransferase 1
MAGFHHEALIEWDKDSCETLSWNRPEWNVIQGDVCQTAGAGYIDVDLLSGGVPCQPFSSGGKQRGMDDERDLFPEAIRLVREAAPRAVMLENVPGLAKFTEYRAKIRRQLRELGYRIWWQEIRACDFGIPQLRPRLVLVAIHKQRANPDLFTWPEPIGHPPTVGDVLYPLMSSRHWPGAAEWRTGAQGIAPTLNGAGKSGGPDLGGTRSKEAWLKLGVNGRGIADAPPGPEGPDAARQTKTGTGLPMLTVPMASLVQGFPASWVIQGRKTSAYAQAANAFPPPVALALTRAICVAL